VKPYADTSPRLAWQVVADILALAWIGLWVAIALAVRGLVLRLRAPGEAMIEAGTSLRDTFAGAADRANNLPIIGDDLAGALERGTRPGESLIVAGQSHIDRIETLAFWLMVVLIVLPLLFVLAIWLPIRLRYAREAGAVKRLMRTGAHRDLLALRAMIQTPVWRLVRVSADPVGDWRRGDPAALEALAAIELSELGLRAPPPVTAQS
jgi:hypothetical protein